eukprot:4787999-Pyramimonas_sp.AAC.1
MSPVQHGFVPGRQFLDNVAEVDAYSRKYSTHPDATVLPEHGHRGRLPEPLTHLDAGCPTAMGHARPRIHPDTGA